MIYLVYWKQVVIACRKAFVRSGKGRRDNGLAARQREWRPTDLTGALHQPDETGIFDILDLPSDARGVTVEPLDKGIRR